LVKGRGLLEVTVEPDGHVSQAIMREPLSPGYDELLIRTAKTWRYQPATTDGRPIPFVITIPVAVNNDK
jgi:TonB family protein